MEGLSERGYAEHAGISRGAVQKARKTGRLVLFADRSINAAASDVRRGAATDPVRVSRDGGHRFHLIVGSDFTGSWASISRDLGH